jgi:hypothetical protein
MWRDLTLCGVTDAIHSWLELGRVGWLVVPWAGAFVYLHERVVLCNSMLHWQAAKHAEHAVLEAPRQMVGPHEQPSAHQQLRISGQA